MTCKDCICYEILCRHALQDDELKLCKHFKNKADFVEVKHGEWIVDGEYQVCSVCGEEHHWDEYRATYCEDCGAKMDGKGDT